MTRVVHEQSMSPSAVNADGDDLLDKLSVGAQLQVLQFGFQTMYRQVQQ